MAMVYQWKAGTQHKVDPQVAGEELERIRTWNNGRLEPKAVVDASRDPGAPLHSAFEWNDKRAALAWRMDQASTMIRHIAVMVDKGGEAAPVRAFVSVMREDDRSYTSIGHALSDQELRLQVVAAAWAELEAWRKRHAELIELTRIFAVIDQARIAS